MLNFYNFKRIFCSILNHSIIIITHRQSFIDLILKHPCGHNRKVLTLKLFFKTYFMGYIIYIVYIFYWMC